jgi:hypothetical protein
MSFILGKVPNSWEHSQEYPASYTNQVADHFRLIIKLYRLKAKAIFNNELSIRQKSHLVQIKHIFLFASHELSVDGFKSKKAKMDGP